MPELFLIGHGFMLYDNVDGTHPATRYFDKPDNVDIVFYIAEYTSAYGPNTLAAVARNVANHETSPNIVDRVKAMNFETRLDNLVSETSTSTDCTAIIAEDRTPNHLLVLPGEAQWEREYIRILQQWHKPDGWTVNDASGFPTCRAKYGDREGASLSSIAFYCARTHKHSVIHWLVCRDPLQTTPCLPPKSPLKEPLHQSSKAQGLKENVDKHQTFSVLARKFGMLLKAQNDHDYELLGKKWCDFERKYFVISDLSVTVLGGGDAMKTAAAQLVSDTDAALKDVRELLDLSKRLTQVVVPEIGAKLVAGAEQLKLVQQSL
jgi:hypothetical protein